MNLSLNWYPYSYHAWECNHCLNKTHDRPWVYFLFSWHEMDCPYRRALQDWVTIPAPTGNDGSYIQLGA